MTALRDAFLFQADACEGLDSPFMGRLLRLLADRWPTDTALAQKCAAWQGDIGPMAASLPLRIAGGLHALVLQGMDPALAAAYPPNSVPDADLWLAVQGALHTHDAFLTEWIDHAPQTNEVRRSAVLIGAAHLLSDRFGMPIRLTELGASAGLNLMFDQFHMTLDGADYGPQSPVQLAPDWRGPLPPKTLPHITERRGVDLNPLNAQDPADQLRLLAYLWPDQSERLARTRAAIALQDAPLEQGDAIDWLERNLTPVPGTLHLIYHTVAWQYFPTHAQERGEEIIVGAGHAALPDTPLAWLSLEADDKTPGAAIRLRLWPGNHDIDLGRADFHGRWVDWQAPTHLP
ncbi:DUF2332 domain-containing protein [Shimia sp. W99]